MQGSNPNNTSAVRYLVGDAVMLALWTVLIVFVGALSSITSYFLTPLWIFAGLCTLALLLPKVKPGVYDLKSKETSLWFVSFQFGRLWGFPPFKHVIFSFAILRTIFLSCCGAKISMNIGWSAVSTVSDPSMFSIDSGVIIGVETLISGHSIIHGKLYLAPIHIKQGALIGGRSCIGPGCTIGENVILEGAVEVLPGTTIPNGVQIGKRSVISKKMQFVENTRYPGFMRPPEQSSH